MERTVKELREMEEGLRRAGLRLVVLAEVESTNLSALELGRSASGELVVVAGRQTGGRGRMGRVWVTPPGCLAMSVVLRPTLPLERWPQLSLAAAVGVAEGIERVTGLKATLKWPNDLLVRERKLAGILCEADDASGCLVIGVGLNVTLDPGDLPPGLEATSLEAETGGRPHLGHLTGEVALAIKGWAGICAREGLAPVLERWRPHLAGLKREVEVVMATSRIRGRMVGIDPDGALRVRTAQGQEVRVLAGDLRLVEAR